MKRGEERLGPSRARTLLLDMGKVLFDFDFQSFGDRIAAAAGIDCEAVRSALTSEGLAARYECGAIDDLEFHGEICRRMDSRVEWECFVEAWNSIFRSDPILPEALIERLAGRADLWVVSNTNALHFRFVRERYPLLRHFRGYVLSHEVGAMKPDPRIFAAALERARTEPERTVFVDDRMENVEAARTLGIDAFQFIDRESFQSELHARGLLESKD